MKREMTASDLRAVKVAWTECMLLARGHSAGRCLESALEFAKPSVRSRGSTQITARAKLRVIRYFLQDDVTECANWFVACVIDDDARLAYGARFRVIDGHGDVKMYDGRGAWSDLRRKWLTELDLDSRG